MIEVLFFASIREHLGVERLSVPFVSGQTVASLQDQLVNEYGELWQQTLCADNVIKAVNQQVAEESTLLEEGDEVAFYPPVTGG